MSTAQPIRRLVPTAHSLRPSAPDISHEQLIDYWTNVKRSATMIKGVTRDHVIFQTQLPYPIEQLPHDNNRKTHRRRAAWYRATSVIPRDHSIFDTDVVVEYVYPSVAAPYTTFKFDYCGDI